MTLKAISLIDYTVLPCHDLQRTRQFYRDVMGFSIAEERTDWIKFQIGATALALRPQDGHFSERRVLGPAVQLAFRVEYGEVDTCYSELNASGVEIVEPPTDQSWQHRTLYFKDPEGNILEIFADIPIQQNETS